MPRHPRKAQGGRKRSGPKYTARITLPCTVYERQALQHVAAHRGVVPMVATASAADAEHKGVGAILLRVLSLNDIVAEYERLKADGKVAAA